MKARVSVDAEEVERFSRIAEEWWDEHGKFGPLHRLNPTRLRYLRARVETHFGKAVDAAHPLAGLRLLDIGCGGGLISEPMARLGAAVTGVDASERNIRVAALHAEQMGLAIDYRASTAEALLAAGERYDVVLALEIVEHVADVPLFLECLAGLTKPGGLLILSTLNRTMKSLLLAKIGAEYVLRWVPAGTHEWHKFLRPSELVEPLERQGLTLTDLTGMVFSPLKNEWRLDGRDLEVNYLASFAKPG